MSSAKIMSVVINTPHFEAECDGKSYFIRMKDCVCCLPASEASIAELIHELYDLKFALQGMGF